MQLVDEYRSVQDLRSWVACEGLDYVAYRLWDDEFSGYSEDEVRCELVRVLG